MNPQLISGFQRALLATGLLEARMRTGVLGRLRTASMCEPRSQCYNLTEEVYLGGSRLGFELAMMGKGAR